MHQTHPLIEMQQQERGGKQPQQQDRRLKPMGENQQQQQQQPQKCPRCESLNTKFCYYNNYSLSQPRFFCKTCRRYWTQGGTLRNVPVGGGCRKGKRIKTSSSSSGTDQNSTRSSSQAPAPPPLQQQQVSQNSTNPQNLIYSSNLVITDASTTTSSSPVLRTKELVSSMASYYPPGGFLSSLASIQQSQSFNQDFNVGGGDDQDLGLGVSSNLSLLQGFTVPSFGMNQSSQFYQMGNRDDQKSTNLNPIYHNPPEESLIHSYHHQGFVNNNTNPNVTDTALWSISTSSSGNTNSNTNTGSMNPNQWPDDLQGNYGTPPP